MFDRYASQHGIEALEGDSVTAKQDLPPEEAVEVNKLRRDMARSIILQWKLNRTLYRQYGGRIIAQQLGPEPLDAYRQFLEKQQRAWVFTIHVPELEAAFWRYFTDDSLHSFIEAGSMTEAKAFKSHPGSIRRTVILNLSCNSPRDSQLWPCESAWPVITDSGRSSP